MAAGRGVRFGGETVKQYQPIGGVPMVLRALRPFTSHPEVAQVVLVLPPEDAADPTLAVVKVVGSAVALVAIGALLFWRARRKARRAP